MTPDAPLKLLAELRDLTIVDRDGRHCGMCDEIEFSGAPGSELKIVALLVGPGAYRKRLPRWFWRALTAFTGDNCVRIGWSEVDHISGQIHLAKKGEDLGLRRVEDWFAAQFARVPRI
jgi:hypothetical protein